MYCFVMRHCDGYRWCWGWRWCSRRAASGAAQLDTVTATGSGSGPVNININAQSGTSGQNPSGTVAFGVVSHRRKNRSCSRSLGQ